MVFKTCFVTVFTYGEMMVVLKELIFCSLHLRGCGGIQNLFCNRFNFGVGCGGVERTYF